MKSLRDEIAEVLNTAHEAPHEDHPALVKAYRHDGHDYHGACYVCRGDVNELADRVRDRLVTNHWMNLVVVAKLQEIADYYPAHIFKPDGTSRDSISGTAIRDRMLAEIRALRERAAELEAEVPDA